MLKSIQLKLSKIKYSGDSVGDDMRVKVELLDKFLITDKRIKRGTTVDINKEVGKFSTDMKLFLANIRIFLIEKDILFNDIGSIEGNIKINTDNTESQKFVYKVEIKETRSILGKVLGKSVANFEITLEATVTDTVKYIPEENDGWLVINIKGSKSVESLPAYLKVRVDRTDEKREYFTILEGSYRGKVASVKLKTDGSSQFVSDISHEPEIYATYSISKKIFTLKGKKYETVDYSASQWRKGLYDIEIPDAPHGDRLNNTIKRASTWFRVGHIGDRYLHTGQRSLGCITIIENARWLEIYNILIKARKNDFVSVGVIEVID